MSVMKDVVVILNTLPELRAYSEIILSKDFLNRIPRPDTGEWAIGPRTPRNYRCEAYI